MKNLSFFHKVLFFINNLAAIMLLASFALPFVSPKSFPILSVISLFVPLLLFIHVAFLLFWWLVSKRRQSMLSLFCLLITIAFSYFPYKFKGKTVVSGTDLKVMSYNVRIFNEYGWLTNEQVPQEISTFIKTEDPDVLALQEYFSTNDFSVNLPYKYELFRNKRNPSGLSIYSKYKIVNKGSLDFERTNNNAIYIDILKGHDTIRIYNVHLESLGIKPDHVDLKMDEEVSKQVIGSIKRAFVKQQYQVEKLLNHRDASKKVIICGDFNNTRYSWAYSELKGDLNDTFTEAGKGFGKTYSFKKYPLRIDFILSDPYFEVNGHRNYSIGLSDHEPIMARLGN